MPDVTTAIGTAAAICTSVSYIPQVKKSWSTGETGDLSLAMLAVLALGLATWIVYGVLRRDAVVMIANGVSLALLASILVIKVRNAVRGKETAE